MAMAFYLLSGGCGRRWPFDTGCRMTPEPVPALGINDQKSEMWDPLRFAFDAAKIKESRRPRLHSGISPNIRHNFSIFRSGLLRRTCRANQLSCHVPVKCVLDLYVFVQQFPPEHIPSLSNRLDLDMNCRGAICPQIFPLSLQSQSSTFWFRVVVPSLLCFPST